MSNTELFILTPYFFLFLLISVDGNFAFALAKNFGNFENFETFLFFFHIIYSNLRINILLTFSIIYPGWFRPPPFFFHFKNWNSLLIGLLSMLIFTKSVLSTAARVILLNWKSGHGSPLLWSLFYLSSLHFQVKRP